MIYTVSTSLLYIEIYSPTQRKADFGIEDSSAYKGAVRCLQSWLVFSEGNQTWMNTRQFRKLGSISKVQLLQKTFWSDAVINIF